MTDFYSKGWKALKQFEQQFCSIPERDAQDTILSAPFQTYYRGDTDGSTLVHNTSYLPTPGPYGVCMWETGDRIHLIHTRLDLQPAGKVKWALRSFHGILQMDPTIGRYMPKSRYLKEVKFAVNPTEDGYRFQILKTQGGRTCVYWGYDPEKLMQEIGDPEMWRAARNVVYKYLIPDQMYKVLQWFRSENPVEETEQLRLGGPGWSRILTGKTGAKDILNGVYDPKGVRRIPKNAFGGVGEIRTLNALAKAVFITRAWRSLDPHTFGEVSNALSKDFRLVYNGSFEQADKIDWLVSRIPKLPIGREENFESIDLLSIEDMITMLKQMPRALRSACLAEIRRSANRGMQWAHDYVVLEFNKLKTADKVIEQDELSRFEGTVNDDMICVVPKSTHDLVQWGTEYNICIGSYADRVYRGNTLCMGFQNPHTKSFYGFAEVNPQNKKLVQLLGKYNHSLDNLDKLAIECYLTSKGVGVDFYRGK